MPTFILDLEISIDISQRDISQNSIPSVSFAVSIAFFAFLEIWSGFKASQMIM